MYYIFVFYPTIPCIGLLQLCQPLTRLPKGLTQLHLVSTGLTTKGINRLAEALSGSQYILSSLKTLNLRGNLLKGDDITVSERERVRERERER